ncbi:MAG TPA: hypothetical protein VEU30_07750 [Thermoanaerobaculia bacterium]|nr:hypothetical protein [Thermoanaerobaculia bacterium]
MPDTSRESRASTTQPAASLTTSPAFRELVPHAIFDAVPVSDTTPQAAAMQLQLYRSVGPSERVRIAVELSEAARETALAGIRRRHPEYTDREIRRSFVALVYGISVKR